LYICEFEVVGCFDPSNSFVFDKFPIILFKLVHIFIMAGCAEEGEKKKEIEVIEEDIIGYGTSTSSILKQIDVSITSIESSSKKISSIYNESQAETSSKKRKLSLPMARKRRKIDPNRKKPLTPSQAPDIQTLADETTEKLTPESRHRIQEARKTNAIHKQKIKRLSLTTKRSTTPVEEVKKN